MNSSAADLFREYHGSLVRMLTRRTGDPERAEEIAQEVFARAVVAPPRNPRPWLFAVALNLLREEGRRSVRQDRRLVLYKAEHDSAIEGPDEAMDRTDRIQAVRTALALLNERDRDALLLKAEGFSYDDIASTLGLSRGAIGTTLSRARQRLVEAYRAGEARHDVAS